MEKKTQNACKIRTENENQRKHNKLESGTNKNHQFKLES